MSRLIIPIGHDNFVPSNKVLAVLSRETRSIKPIISKAELNQCLIDATNGKKVRTVILTTDNFVVLSSITPKTIADRFAIEGDEGVLAIGGENYIPNQQITAILQKDSSPIKEKVKQARAHDKVINAQMGKRMKGMVHTSEGYFFLSFHSPQTLANRFIKSELGQQETK